MRQRTDPVHTRGLDRCGPSFSEEIPMKRDWIEDGWRRFLDRLKGLWGKRTDIDADNGLIAS